MISKARNGESYLCADFYFDKVESLFSKHIHAQGVRAHDLPKLLLLLSSPRDQDMSTRVMIGTHHRTLTAPAGSAWSSIPWWSIPWSSTWENNPSDVHAPCSSISGTCECRTKRQRHRKRRESAVSLSDDHRTLPEAHKPFVLTSRVTSGLLNLGVHTKPASPPCQILS